LNSVSRKGQKNMLRKGASRSKGQKKKKLAGGRSHSSGRKGTLFKTETKDEERYKTQVLKEKRFRRRKRGGIKFSEQKQKGGKRGKSNNRGKGEKRGGRKLKITKWGGERGEERKGDLTGEDRFIWQIAEGDGREFLKGEYRIVTRKGVEKKLRCVKERSPFRQL